MFGCHRWLAAAAAAVLFTGSAALHAQGYPAKSIRIIVAFPPGGTSDVVARVLAQKLNETFGQPVVVENRPGAGGSLGAELVAKAPADGYTLLFSSPAELAINVSLYTKLPYDPIRDFTPVTLATSAPLILVAHPSLPVKSVRDLIALAKARPRELNFGSGGSGSSPHMALELMREMAKVEFNHIPYKGTTPALADLLGGHLQLLFAGLTAALPQVRADKLRALAVTTAKRSSLMPALPTVAESGLGGYVIDNWQGAVLPANAPREIVARLNSEMVKILSLPEMKQRLSEQGAEPVGTTPERFAEYIKSEIDKYAQIIRKSGAKVD
jgi:tripartite-type tricarboxylate transporter receptor subunit TctC